MKYDPFTHVRRTDPLTSYTAAVLAESLVKRHHDAILTALTLGAAGKDEIAQRANMTPYAVSKRLSELQAVGSIILTGRVVPSNAGRPEREWRLTGQTND